MKKLFKTIILFLLVTATSLLLVACDTDNTSIGKSVVGNTYTLSEYMDSKINEQGFCIVYISGAAGKDINVIPCILTEQNIAIPYGTGYKDLTYGNLSKMTDQEIYDYLMQDFSYIEADYLYNIQTDSTGNAVSSESMAIKISGDSEFRKWIEETDDYESIYRLFESSVSCDISQSCIFFLDSLLFPVEYSVEENNVSQVYDSEYWEIGSWWFEREESIDKGTITFDALDSSDERIYTDLDDNKIMEFLNDSTDVVNAKELVAVTVYFDEDATQDYMDQAKENAESYPGVAFVNFIPAEEAWENYKQEYFDGDEEAAAAFGSENPLANEASLKIHLTDLSVQQDLVDYLEGLDGVRRVQQAELIE